MEKSYILKFSQTKGDYVIVEDTQKRRKNLFEIFENKLSFRQKDQNQLKNGLNKLENGTNLQNNANINENSTVPQDNPLPNNSENQNPSDQRPQTDQPVPNITRPTPQIDQPAPNLTRPLPQNRVPVTPTPTLNPPLAVTDSLPLISSLYSKFRVLNMIYQNLRSINNEFAQIFNDFIQTNTFLQGGLLNIFNSFNSNGRIDNGESVPILPSSAQDIFKIVSDQILQMREINFELMRMFEVEDVERHLNLIDTSLSIQFDQVTNLRIA